MKLGDLVVNTYPHAAVHSKGKLGLVIKLESHNQALVKYNNRVCLLTRDCLEVISEAR